MSVQIGDTYFTPIGFADFAVVFRDKNVGSGLGTNFAGIPFDNTVNGNLRDYRLSSQNSRLRFRVDSKMAGVNLLGYVEADFLGFVPGNAAVTANSNSLRMPCRFRAALMRLHLDPRMPYPMGGQRWVRHAQIAVASLYLKAAKGCFFVRFVRIVQIENSTSYAELDGCGRTNPSSSATSSLIGRQGFIVR